jgi:hypothetical protein
MEIASIKGDTVLLLYHPSESPADVGQQFTILELPERTEGLVVQVISNDSLEYVGLQQELIQHILEQRIARVERPIDRETGMGEIKSLKVATAKIRKRVRGGTWETWDGWIPTRNAELSRIEADNLLGNVLPKPLYPIRSFATFNGTQIQFDGPRLNMVNVIAGVKGSGKSHLAKHLVLALSERHVPCIVFDINGEYAALPAAQVLKWGENFRPNLAQVGYEMLSLVIRGVYPLPETSEHVLDGMLPVIFGKRRQHCEKNNQTFNIDIAYLRSTTWSNNDYIQNAIDDRLRVLEGMSLFCSTTKSANETDIVTDFDTIYENACYGKPVVLDMRDLSNTLQHALVKAMNKAIEDICGKEVKAKGRFPFVFYEEAHFYVTDVAILNIITRGRHIGMGSFFVTNTPQNLPDTVFRQLDNLFLLGLTHRDDIRNVSKNSFTDEDTIQSFATRMPEHHALIVGQITDRYPLVVKIEDLPEGIPPTGRTRSTWDRFKQQA